MAVNVYVTGAASTAQAARQSAAKHFTACVAPDSLLLIIICSSRCFFSDTQESGAPPHSSQKFRTAARM
jgi:hypothetical protein